MLKFKKIKTEIEGLVIIEPSIFKDYRGFFLESYNRKDFIELDIKDEFVQDNHSKSKKGVLRGLHFQTRYSQGKLIKVINGCIYDVVVDLRKESETFGKWFGIILSAKNKKMLYIPKNFAHGFLVLQENTECIYKCTDYYFPEFESGIIWNDEEINIDWKLKEFGFSIESLIFSEKDKKYQNFKEFKKNLEK